MKKIFSIFAALLFVGSMMAEQKSVIMDFSSNGYKAITITKGGTSSTGGDYEISQGDITLTGTLGLMESGKCYVYKSGTMVISAGGATIDSVLVKYNKDCRPFAEAIPEGGGVDKKTTAIVTVKYIPTTATDSVKFTNKGSGKTELKGLTVYYRTVAAIPTVSVAVAEGQEEMGSVAMSYKANSTATEWTEANEPVEIAGEGAEEFQFVATPADGYKFAGWTTTGDITLTSTTEATTEGSAKETSVVTANFERNATLTSLTISGTATKVTYVAGDTFDPAGLVVTATYSDETEDNVTDQVDWTFDPSILDEATTIVSVSATFKETNSAPFAVNVTVLSAPKTITIDLSKNETTTATAETLEWKGTILTITSSRTSGSTAVNNYYPGTTGKNYTSTRFYKNNTLTFTHADGITLGTITYTATSEDYATAMANSTWTNAKASVNGTTVTITPTDGEKVVSATIGATTGGTSFVINYFGEAKPTAIDNTAVETPVIKTIENGQLVILRDGVKYNAMGVRLQ